jgi:hypothetical protein
MRLSTSAASPAFGLNKRLADFVDRNEISSDRQNKDRSLGESRLAPFFRDGLEVDPQDVVGREVNPRIPVAALIGPENNRKNVTDPLLSRRGWPTDPARKAIG